MIKLVAIRRDGSLAEHTVMSSEVETSLFAEPGTLPEVARAVIEQTVQLYESVGWNFPWVGHLALVNALVGEQDQAITLIERLLSTPGPIQWPYHPMTITLAELRLRWEWDSLRSNPRFQKILAAPEPKTALTTKVQATASIISAR